MKKKKIITILFFTIGLSFIAIIGINIFSYFIFRYKIKKLFEASPSVKSEQFQIKQFENLPIPVKKYFINTLKENQPYIDYVSLKYNGCFKLNFDDDFYNLMGEQYFTTENPGFIWKGNTFYFSSIESYIDNFGTAEIWVLSLFYLYNESGGQINDRELSKWVAESVWFPTNLLPSKKLKWIPQDSLHSKIMYVKDASQIEMKVTFNNTGEIIEMSTMRYYDDKTFKQWICKFSNYQLIENVRIPTEYESFWEVNNQKKCYSKFNLNSITFQKPKYF